MAPTCQAAPKSKVPKSKAPKSKVPKSKAPKSKVPKSKAPKSKRPSPKSKRPSPKAKVPPKSSPPKATKPKAKRFALRQLTVNDLYRATQTAKASGPAWEVRNPKIKVRTFQWNAERPPRSWSDLEGDWQQDFTFLGLMKKELRGKTVEITDNFFDHPPKGPYYAGRQDPHFYYLAFLASGFKDQIYWAQICSDPLNVISMDCLDGVGVWIDE